MSTDELEDFVSAVRTRALQDESYDAPSLKQMTKLVIQIEGALANKKNRLPVLQALTGLPIQSQKELTRWYHSVLIDETLEGRSDAHLRRIEAELEAQPVCNPVGLYPWYRPVAYLPDLQEASSEVW